MMTLAEQQKLPWCNCDFRATGEWSWCKNYDWCEGRQLAQAIEARRATTENTGVVADESAVAKPCAQGGSA